MLICDLDRTLVHRHSFDELFTELVSEYGYDAEAAQNSWQHSHGTPVPEQMVKLGHSHKEAEEFTKDLFARAKDLQVYPLEGALDLLRAAKRRDWVVCVSSGSSQELVEQALEAAELDHLVDLAQGSDPGHLKGLAHMEKIVGHFQLEDPYFRKAAFVGDGSRDMAIAAEHSVPLRVALYHDHSYPSHSPGPLKDDLWDSGATHIVDTLYQARRVIFG
jgi:phosphoglycolate phosphatase-like HAD superfamily hydrolase